jgi:hypothetical protein
LNEIAASASPLSAPVAVEAAPHRGWIESPTFDLAFFTLSPLVGLMVVLLTLNMPHGLAVTLAASFLLGMPHYLATFTFYLGDENRAHYLARPVAFVVMPVAIVGAVVALRAVHLDTPVILAMFLWNIYHVSLQSNGILSLYRQLNGGLDSERNVGKVALIASACAMTFWQPVTFPPLVSALNTIAPGVFPYLRFAFAALALGAAIVLAARALSRPRRVSFAEGSFFVSSILLFHPYLWVRDGNLATLGMLCGHFIQYLVIVWLLNFRKYAGQPGSRAQRLLGAIGGNPLLVCAWILAAAVIVFGLSQAAKVVGLPVASIVFLNSLALVHFYLDGRIWSFKQPFVRRSISPFLTPPSRRVA